MNAKLPPIMYDGSPQLAQEASYQSYQPESAASKAGANKYAQVQSKFAQQAAEVS